MGKAAISRISNGKVGGGGGSEFKERWVRLRANCLFYWRHTSGSAKPSVASEPLGVLILEASHAQQGLTIPHCFMTCTGILSQIRTKLCDWAVWQARAGCYSQAALSSNDSKTLKYGS